MKNENLLLIFAKNVVLGKAKTRLAKTVGDTAAFNVYCRLVEITEQESQKLKDADIHVYFSDEPIQSLWSNEKQYVQEGADLGIRMRNAFEEGFRQGYRHIIGIGTDLPDLNAMVMTEALNSLKNHDTVFGPSDDGGYYVIGMNKMIPEIFINKPWSTELLLETTLKEIQSLHLSTHLLPVLNDVDTIEDLRASWLIEEFETLK